MKKNILTAIILFTVGISFGQQVLSHSVNNTSINPLQSIACGASGNNTDDNIWYRVYRPSDFNFSGDFQVMGAQFFIEFNELSEGSIADINLRVFTSLDATFPTGTLTEIATQSFTIDIEDNGVQRIIMLDNPVIVNATDEIIIAIDSPSTTEPFQYAMHLGVNNDGQFSPGYLSSISCGITIPTDFAEIGGGLPSNHVVLDLLGDTFLAIEDTLLQDGISMFPNPTQGDITLRFASNFGATNVSIINTNGQKVYNNIIEGVSNYSLPTSKLTSGMYFVQIRTQTATANLKFIKS